MLNNCKQIVNDLNTKMFWIFETLVDERGEDDRRDIGESGDR